MSTRPLPAPDATSLPYWVAATEHRLAIAQCSRCNRFVHPPDIVCPECGSTDPGFEFVPVGGHGFVRSWTIVRRSFLPGFTDLLPFTLVDVELVEQPELRLVGRLVGGDLTDLRIGAPVVVAFEDLTPEVSIPAFELVS